MIAVGCEILLLLTLSVAGPFAARRTGTTRLAYAGSLLCCLGLMVSGTVAIASPTQEILLPLGVPWTGMHLRLDAVAGFFVLLLGIGGAAASLYAIDHNDADASRILPFYPGFLAAMGIVLVANDAFAFLFGWELMSLLSWALVLAHRAPENARAGFIYLIMAAFSGLTLFLAFGLLASADGAYAFDVMRETPHPALVASIVLILALIGTGAKAGLVPLHVWLPLAHPAAPTQVSALMSGVMTKIAVYGFIRIVFDLLGPNPWWAGTVVLVAGGLTAVLGILQATVERDLKTLLAYSTVENIGIIFVGLGLALAFRANGFPVLAALATTAALFHALNHTLFKSLLFFGAGAVIGASGERDLDRLGGLIHRMPRTAFACLVGCVAISALPPLNGFASEWLIFQAMLLHPELPQWGLKLAIPASGALLALAAALAAACFVRLFGICFLGRPRSAAASQARETEPSAQAAMLVLAVLCLAAGILPGLVIDSLAPVTEVLTGARMPIQLSDPWLTIVPVASSGSAYNGLLVFLFIAASALLAIIVVRRLGGAATRRAPAWDCGFPDPAPETQYTAASFAQPIRRVFGRTVFGFQDRLTMPAPGAVTPAQLVTIRRDPFWDGLYSPLGRIVRVIAGRLARLQYLSLRQYLSFVFAALILLLLALTLWQ